ncbi:MAG: acyl-CoA dehydrogenase [Gammaproteobacteria bacterium]|nr:acyl-CoA dehydrogenase [Gammaproteobacteria bacterium]
MDFGFSEEQNLLREQVLRFMTEACPLSVVRTQNGALPRELWRQAADLGWLALIVPEAYGGVGLKWIDLAVVLEETGRGLSPLPIVSQALAATAIGRSAGDGVKGEWLPRIAAGEAVFGVGLYDDPTWIDPQGIRLEGVRTLTGAKRYVSDATAATHFLLATRTDDELNLVIVDANHATLTAQPGIDRTKPFGTATLDGVAPLAACPISADDLAFLTDCGAVAVTLEAIGAAEAVLELTTEYANNRIQFDNPIGKYQGVKHRLADMFVDIESFKSLAYYAAWAIDEAPDELSRAASLAKAYASDAFARIGIDGVGLHGAIGFTAEYDAQLYLKRSKWVRSAFGDADYHYQRAAAIGGL